jgi:hypothetical protein
VAAGDFTAFGVVNRPTNWSYNKSIGNLNLNAMADANRGALIGDVNYATPVGTVGYSKGLNAPKDMYYRYGGDNFNIEARPNGIRGSYMGDGFQVNATDKSLDTSFNIPIEDKSMDASFGINYDGYTKTPAVQAQIRKDLFDNGFIDATGNLTPKGYELSIQAGYKF